MRIQRLQSLAQPTWCCWQGTVPTVLPGASASRPPPPAEDPGCCALAGLQIAPLKLPARGCQGALCGGEGLAGSGTVLARRSSPGHRRKERRARGMWSNQSPLQSEALR